MIEMREANFYGFTTTECSTEHFTTIIIISMISSMKFYNNTNCFILSHSAWCVNVLVNFWCEKKKRQNSNHSSRRNSSHVKMYSLLSTIISPKTFTMRVLNEQHTNTMEHVQTRISIERTSERKKNHVMTHHKLHEPIDDWNMKWMKQMRQILV